MKHKKLLAMFLASAMAMGSLIGCGGNEKKVEEENGEVKKTEETQEDNEEAKEEVTLTMLIDNGAEPDGYEAVLALAEEKLGIHVDVEIRPGGDEGDNIVKTRLASGDMADLCIYNTGSLLSALNPSEYFIDVTDLEVASTFDDAFTNAASVDGVLYGVPFGSSSAGGVMYNKELYEKYSLEVPETWDEFKHNLDVLKDAGENALIGSFGESWTAQVPYLADNYAVLAQEPDFPEEFTKGTKKYATSEAGLRSWEKLAETTPYYNKDYLATNYNDACDMLVNGDGAHYIMLTMALRNIYSLYGEEVNKIGFFPIPGDTKEQTGLTVWASGAIYGNKNTGKVEDIKRFMEFWVSDEAIDACVEKVLPDGPYHNGYKLPDTAYEAVRVDMQKYFDEGKTALALEFMTPVKGANCPAICQELGSGQTTAEEAAKAYDEDCKKQAVQLGLGWK